MRRMLYGLLALAALVCSIGAGVMTYEAAMDGEAQKQKQAEILEQLNQETWYLPLSEEYSGIAALDEEGEYFSAWVYDGKEDDNREFFMDRHGRILYSLPDGMSLTGSAGDGLAVFENEDGKQGYLNMSGDVVLPAKYEEAYPFDDGYAKVEIKAKDGNQKIEVPIDSSGKVLYDPQEQDQWPDWYSIVEQIEGKYFLLKSRAYHGTYRIFDAEKGKVIKKLEEYSGMAYFYPVGEGRYVYSRNGDIMLVDENFDPVAEGKLYSRMKTYCEGLCYAQWLEDGVVTGGYIDRDGKVKIPMPEAVYGGRFSEGKAMVWTEDRACIIDKAGRKLFDKPLARPLEEEAFGGGASTLDESFPVEACWYRDGLAVFYDGKHYGIIDEEGRWVIEPVFEELCFIGEDMANARFDGKSGLLKTGGSHE